MSIKYIISKYITNINDNEVLFLHIMSARDAINI